METKIPLLVDSGQYSAFTHKTTIPTEEYIEWLKVMVKEYPDVEYISMDEIADKSGETSWKNFLQMRKAGLNPIPVFSLDMPEKFLQNYLSETKHIALSGLMSSSWSLNAPPLDRVWLKYLVDDDRMPIAKVHGLAFTGTNVLKRYPWYSVDSTSALQAAMFGKIWVAKWIKNSWVFDEDFTTFAVSSQSPAKKIKGDHFESMTPMEKEICFEYLKYIGFAYGTSKWEEVKGKQKEIPIEVGVSNSHIVRGLLNIQYLSRFSEKLIYPRPLDKEVRPGIFS